MPLGFHPGAGSGMPMGVSEGVLPADSVPVIEASLVDTKAVVGMPRRTGLARRRFGEWPTRKGPREH